MDILQSLRQASTWHTQGRLAEAERVYREVLQRHPGHPEALYLLGTLAHDVGRSADAIPLLRRAVAAAPGRGAFHYNLGVALTALQHWGEAVTAFRETVRLLPDDAEAWNNLGSALYRSGDPFAAIEAYRQSLRFDPDEPQVLNNLGCALSDVADYEQAIACYRQCLRHPEKRAEAWTNLGNIHRSLGEIDEALRCYEQALEIRPDYPLALSNRLFVEAYHVLLEPEAMLAAHREWDARFGGPERAGRFRHERGGDPERRLRIGYCSPDLRRHSVSYFLEPILAHHDRERFEIHCYAEVASPDEVTARLRGLVDGWVSTVGQSDEAVADRIHADGIDILVDLAGHTAGNRLGVFAYRPAPVQVTYLGYFTTTGLSAMDYWLTDAVVTPADTVERTTERIWRLPRCSLGYTPPESAPAVAERPADGPLVLGCFNDLSKVTPRAIGLWSRVLRRLPEARLLLKARQLADAGMCEQVRSAFAAEGIDPGRLDLRGRTADLEAHLSLYGEVDIALDTVPRTGGATTAEALWMGVPVVTLAGERYIERLSATMLTAVGLEDLVCADESSYVERVAALAADTAGRRALRAGLRERMAASCLADGRDLAAAIEAAYRGFWRRWLDEANEREYDGT